MQTSLRRLAICIMNYNTDLIYNVYVVITQRFLWCLILWLSEVAFHHNNYVTVSVKSLHISIQILAYYSKAEIS